MLDTSSLNEAKHHLSTLGDCLRFAVSQFNEASLFYGHGTQNAYEEAIALLMPALHLAPEPHADFIQATLLAK